jgi:hypothetical protein
LGAAPRGRGWGLAGSEECSPDCRCWEGVQKRLVPRSGSRLMEGAGSCLMEGAGLTEGGKLPAGPVVEA